MCLPLMQAKACGGRGWQRAGAALLVVVALGVASRPAGAQDADAFSATVAVDATADSVIKARDVARLDGQRRALAAVVERQSGGNAPAKLPKLDDKAITDLVASFEVANERMSAVRYVADYTFHFQKAGVQRLLGNAGIAAAAEPGKPLVVIPVYQAGGQSRLWDDPNPWREAWESQPAASGPVKLIVPLGDAGDIAAIDADKALGGDAEALAAIARQSGTDEAVVALAAQRMPTGGPAGFEVSVRRYRAGRLVDSHVVPLTDDAGESDDALLRRGVAATVAGIASGWKKEAATGYDQQGTLTAVMPIAGLDDWLRARQLLAGVPAVRKVAMMSLSRQEATIEIGYVGSIDQLNASLAGVSLELMPGDPAWRLARSGGGRSR